MSNHLARFFTAFSIALIVTGCQLPQNKQGERLGAPPNIFIFFEGNRQHVLSLEEARLARYQVLDGEDRGIIDLVEGDWSKTDDQLTLLFYGADSQHEWTLKAIDSGYELLNTEVIDLEMNTTVQFQNITEYDVALRLYEWQLTQVETNTISELVQTPSLYSFEVKDEASYILRADCNEGIGHYRIRGNVLEVVPGLITKKACPTHSLSDQFVQWLLNEHKIAWGDSYQQLVFTSRNARLTFNAVNAFSLR